MPLRKIVASVALARCFASLTVGIGSGEGKGLAPEIIRKTGIRGGLSVHLGADGLLVVGCEDGREYAFREGR